MKTEFSILIEWIQKLRSRYLHISSALCVYETVSKLSASNKVGKKKAEENVKTFNDFKYFFLTSKEACRVYFFMEIAKFFDFDGRALSMGKCLDFAGKNIHKLKKVDFIVHHKDRQILPEIFKGYKELTLSELKEMRKKINSKKAIIKKIIDYRHQYLAHDDIQKIEVSISKKEIGEVLNVIKAFLKLFYLRLDFSSNDYRNFEKEAEVEIGRLVEYLQNWEVERLKIIEEKWKNFQ